MISLIYACDEANGIGRNNSLPWSIKSDMRFFKKTTENNVVVMGRKTFDSMNQKPLKNRINIILSRDKEYCIKENNHFDKTLINDGKTQIMFFTTELSICSIIEVIEKQFSDKKIFIIGGAEIYKQSINCVDEIIQTKINDEFECDTFFEFDVEKFEKVSEEKLTDFDTDIEITFNTFKRK